MKNVCVEICAKFVSARWESAPFCTGACAHSVRLIINAMNFRFNDKSFSGAIIGILLINTIVSGLTMMAV